MQDKFPTRKRMRLKGYDYSSAGCYSITICTKDMRNILAVVHKDISCTQASANPPSVELTELGEMCSNTIETIENMYDISIPKHIIMPNHIHFILSMDNGGRRATTRVAPTVGLIVGGYKSIVSHSWLARCKERGIYADPIWQRGFHDHIIRDQKDHDRIWKYIDTNPSKWENDYYYTT